MMQNRKTATKLLLVQWSRFQHVCIELEGSTLFTGVNGSGKSTVLDAMTYVLTGNTQFNKAAKDKDRTVKGYVRGDTKSNGATRYLRQGQVVSYIAMEFWSPAEQEHLVIGVCIESPDEVSSPGSSWFVCRNAQIEDLNFCEIDGKNMYVTPKNLLEVKGVRMKSAEFMGRERGTEQIIRALGLRCEVSKYRSKLIKMMAFDPQNNIDQFIAECVLEPGSVDSLKELREQREQFDHIRKMYEDLRDSKNKLIEIENKSQQYETKKRNLNIREMMFQYQAVLTKQKEKEDIEIHVTELEQKKKELEQRQEDLKKLLEAARERLQIAESNDTYQGMQKSIENLKSQVQQISFKIEKEEEQTAKLLRIQKALSSEIAWLLEKLDAGSRPVLLHLGETGSSADQKRKELLRLLAAVEKQQNLLGSQKVHLEDEKGIRHEELMKLEKQLKQLEANQVIFPEEVVKAKQVIKDAFAKKGINAEVRMFAELVQDLKDTSWRQAIETFLGRKRFYLIVDGKYCLEAMRVLQEKKLHAATVVITDKLPDSEVVKGSAAEQLVIPNVDARRYANYLLNGIHLCDSLDELHEYPKGGLMKDGMLAKSYAVSCMNMKKTEICLGQDAIELQKKSVREQKQIVQEAYGQVMDELEQTKEKINSLRGIDLEMDHYHVEAPELLAQNQAEKHKYEDTIRQIQESPEFAAILKEQIDAKKAYQEVETQQNRLYTKIGECQSEQKGYEERQKNISGEINNCENLYEEIRMKYLELERAMLEEYEKLSAKQNEIRVISEQSLKKLSSGLEECEKALESEQLEYCNIAGKDINQRGPAYIPFYRKEYREIANVKIEEVHSKLLDQSRKLESAFMNDFVAENCM